MRSLRSPFPSLASATGLAVVLAVAATATGLAAASDAIAGGVSGVSTPLARV